MEAAIKELRRLDRYDYSTRRPIALINPPWLPYGRTDPSVDRVTWWESDHIVPVVEGGGECGLEGLRTLCWRCHRAETAALAKRRRKPKPTTLLLFEETSP
jgi:5-methylcytosine-specific restriction endonuclease McrA